MLRRALCLLPWSLVFRNKAKTPRNTQLVFLTTSHNYHLLIRVRLKFGFSPKSFIVCSECQISVSALKARWDLAAFLNWAQGHRRPTINAASIGDSSNTAEHLPVLEDACRNCRFPLQVRQKCPFPMEPKRSCLLPLLLFCICASALPVVLPWRPEDRPRRYSVLCHQCPMVCLEKRDFFFLPHFLRSMQRRLYRVSGF